MRTWSRNMSQFFPAVGLLVASLVFGWLVSPALAGPAGKGTKPEPQRLSNAQLREGLTTLQATKKMLQSADHDYGGHRVAAIKAIDAAEHQLRLALKSQHKGKAVSGKAVNKTGKIGKGNGKNREPQNISNLQLADAIVILERTRLLLEKADHDYGGHRAAAVRDLGVAIQQLKAALRFEKKVKG
jgi:hypothetical protein